MSVYYNDNNEYCCKVLQKNIALGHLPGGTVDGRDIRDVSATDLVGYQHIHLFAGIGGFPLGLSRAHVPLSLRTLTGGFPCQDISGAGKRAGITGKRSGLWKEMYRLIQKSIDLHMGYDYILVENVAALVNRGLSTVLGDLASCGYDAEWACLRASDVGAPHQRERIFIVAYPNGVRESRQEVTLANGQRSTSLTTSFRQWKDSESMAHTTCGSQLGSRNKNSTVDDRGYTWMESESSNHRQPIRDTDTLQKSLAHAKYSRCQRREPDSGGTSPIVPCGAATSGEQSQSILGRVLTRLSGGMDGYHFPSGPGEQQHEWEPPRVITTKEQHRVARLEALGNSIVPQLVQVIGESIVESECAA